MKANIYENIKVYTRTVVAGLLLCSGMVACNDVMEDSLKYDYPSADNGNLRSGHVLVVVMDGEFSSKLEFFLYPFLGSAPPLPRDAVFCCLPPLLTLERL